jgi:predicted secreted protein
MPEKAPDEVVELRVGDRHEMRLPGLGTAGYRWRPEPEGETNVAEVSAAGTEGPVGGATGASADELFTIHARRPGSMRLRFAQRRPWEPEDRPAANERIVELRVHNH